MAKTVDNTIDEVLNQIEVCKQWRERLNQKLAEAITRENERTRNGGKATQMYIDESTHIQLTNAISELVKVINGMSDRTGSLPSWEESAKVSKALELRQVALVQLKRAGVTVETKG